MEEMKMDIKVTKYELYPQPNPTGLAVGFTITLEAGQKFYIDTIVDDMTLGVEQATSIAWFMLKSSIDSRIEELTRVVETPSVSNSAVGKGFIPPQAEGEHGLIVENVEVQVSEVQQEEFIQPEEVVMEPVIEEVIETPAEDVVEEPAVEEEVVYGAQTLEIEYESMTVTELKKLANERGLTGYSSMTKAEVIELHREYDAQQ
jgi:hypothetical protein